MTFRAIRADKTEQGQYIRFADMSEDELMPGDVTLQVTHSGVNYKDGLALSGKSPVIRRFPMVLGVDCAGIVLASSHAHIKPGDEVMVTGFGLSETHFGGYAERARVKGDWVLKLPEGLTRGRAMAIGTAGLTAMLSVMAIEAHGLKPADGAALVTGAAGGVGSFAIALLKHAGWHVIASTGRAAEADYLKSLGVDEIIDRAELAKPPRPLAAERWAAGVDSVGSATLASALASTRYGGAIAACGNAGGLDLPASVAPFILRGVALLGVDSVQCPLFCTLPKEEYSVYAHRICQKKCLSCGGPRRCVVLR